MKKHSILLALMLVFCLQIRAQNLSECPNFERYQAKNSELHKLDSYPLVVFIGNSITEGWANQHPDFFTAHNYVGRGISGQTSPQMLLRFRTDVVALKPKVVVINAGTNDIAENTGKYDASYTLGNIQSMAEIAKANGIQVVLSSVLPTGKFPWKEEIKGVSALVDDLNKHIKRYAFENNILYIDYNSLMRDSEGAMRADLSEDGVHPIGKGYDIMENLIQPTLDNILSH